MSGATHLCGMQVMVRQLLVRLIVDVLLVFVRQVMLDCVLDMRMLGVQLQSLCTRHIAEPLVCCCVIEVLLIRVPIVRTLAVVQQMRGTVRVVCVCNCGGGA